MVAERYCVAPTGSWASRLMDSQRGGSEWRGCGGTGNGNPSISASGVDLMTVTCTADSATPQQDRRHSAKSKLALVLLAVRRTKDAAAQCSSTQVGGFTSKRAGSMGGGVPGPCGLPLQLRGLGPPSNRLFWQWPPPGSLCSSMPPSLHRSVPFHAQMGL